MGRPRPRSGSAPNSLPVVTLAQSDGAHGAHLARGRQDGVHRLAQRHPGAEASLSGQKYAEEHAARREEAAARQAAELQAGREAAARRAADARVAELEARLGARR